MTKLTYKEQITQTVLDQFTSDDWTFDNAMKKWWKNPSRDSGLRLSDIGDNEFRRANIEFSDHYVDKIKKSYYSFVIELSKKIKCPYYIYVSKNKEGNTPYIRLYDSRIAVLLTLYGDLESYLNSIKLRQ